MSKQDPLKRPTRIDTKVDAILVTADGHQFPVTIRDVSASGFRLELGEEVLVGEHVRLRIGSREELMGEIKWALGNEAGGAFVDER